MKIGIGINIANTLKKESGIITPPIPFVPIHDFTKWRWNEYYTKNLKVEANKVSFLINGENDPPAFMVACNFGGNIDEDTYDKFYPYVLDKTYNLKYSTNKGSKLCLALRDMSGYIVRCVTLLNGETSTINPYINDPSELVYLYIGIENPQSDEEIIIEQVPEEGRPTSWSLQDFTRFLIYESPYIISLKPNMIKWDGISESNNRPLFRGENSPFRESIYRSLKYSLRVDADRPIILQARNGGIILQEINLVNGINVIPRYYGDYWVTNIDFLYSYEAGEYIKGEIEQVR